LPDVAPHLCPREGPSGDPAKANLKIFTFKAGMCMKTNKTMTKCPKRNGRFRLSFGHFRQTDTNSAEFRGEFTVAYNNMGVNGLTIGVVAGLASHRSAPAILAKFLLPGPRHGVHRSLWWYLG
jgi:hypothetical protein